MMDSGMHLSALFIRVTKAPTSVTFLFTTTVETQQLIWYNYNQPLEVIKGIVPICNATLAVAPHQDIIITHVLHKVAQICSHRYLNAALQALCMTRCRLFFSQIMKICYWKCSFLVMDMGYGFHTCTHTQIRAQNTMKHSLLLFWKDLGAI